MRDAQQSLFATRMRTRDIIDAAPAANAFLANAFSVEAWGGATYDTAYRFLKESPWRFTASAHAEHAAPDAASCVECGGIQ